jgi:methylmalonyl-CoA carboxyltransferase small subunit
VKLKLTIDGKVYEVEVDADQPEQPRPGYIPPAGSARTPTNVSAAPPAAKPGSTADESKVCRSPMAGVVVRVPAQAGQEIQANDVLVVLEAMKMETVVTSPVRGKIAKVHVAPGDSVQSQQVLIEFE